MDDVIVVGGRCAGAPTAMLLAQAGLKVRVIERSPQLGETLSGHNITSAGTARLRAWGLLDAILATGCPPLTGMNLSIDGEPVPATPPADPACPGVAPRRGVLDPMLVEAARQAGAQVDMGNSVRALLYYGTRVTGVRTDRGDVSARLVIGADGRNSRIARLVGATKCLTCPSATYAYYTYWRDTGLKQVCVFFERDCFIGMLPTNDDLTLVFFQAPHAGFSRARRDPMSHYQSLLRSHPAVMKTLSGASPAEPLSGTGDLPTFFRTPAGPGWALAGDARHHKDPLPAHGIADAFSDAEVIASAVRTGWDSNLDDAIAASLAQRDVQARALSSATDAAAAAIGSVRPAALAQAMGALDELEQALEPGAPLQPA